MPTPATLRPLTTDDLSRAIAVLDIAGLSGAKLNLARYLRWQPDCGWAAIADGELIGLVTMLRQGAAAFVGAMAVLPAYQGAGLGRRLLEHAQAHVRAAGVTTMLLEATVVGAKLYRALGYVDEHETVIVGRELAPVAQTAAEPIAIHELPAIAALDRATTGVVRDDLLAGLLAERGAGATIYRDGELCAVAIVASERLAPVLAREPSAGRDLVDRFASACRAATIPAPNEPALAAFAAHGFRELRRLRRMRLGPAIAVRTDWLWALASPGAG